MKEGKKMLVLHLLSTSTFSGAENVVCQIIGMYKDDDSINMIYCSISGPIEESLKKKNINFIGLNKFSYIELKKIIDKYNPDVIHAHDIKASVLASFFNRKCKIISHIHGNSEKMKKASLKSLLFLLSSRKISHIFWVSESCLNEYKYKKYVVSKSTVLKNVISSEEIIEKAGIGNTEKSDLIFVGRLAEIKNPLRMLDIISIVVKKIPSVKMLVVGDGNLYGTMLERISAENLNENIKLVGFQSNPYKYMKNSKLLIMTSIYEGVPMCALEAMALGLPIISTPTDGLVEIIDQNENGFYSEKNEELSAEIIKILKDDKVYKKMSSSAINKSKKINDISKYKDILNKYYF